MSVFWKISSLQYQRIAHGLHVIDTRVLFPTQIYFNCHLKLNKSQSCLLNSYFSNIVSLSSLFLHQEQYLWQEWLALHSLGLQMICGSLSLGSFLHFFRLSQTSIAALWSTHLWSIYCDCKACLKHLRWQLGPESDLYLFQSTAPMFLPGIWYWHWKADFSKVYKS